MARVHHDGAVRYGKKAGDGLLTVVPRARVELALDDGAGIAVCCHERLLQDVGRLALDDRSDPEEALLHVGVHSLWIVEQQRVEPGQKLRRFWAVSVALCRSLARSRSTPPPRA